MTGGHLGAPRATRLVLGKPGTSAVILEGVSKRYGRVHALKDLSLEVPTGSITALVGPNGAGKTTCMGLIAGLLHADAGRVDVLGQGPFEPAVSSGRLGVMPQDAVPSLSLSLERTLRYYAELQGFDGAAAREEARTWLQRVGLAERRKSRYGALSHGMRRRFSVAQAFVGSPELVLLDEPTSGLDPELVVSIRRLIVEQKGRSTILVSSHILSELQSMCDHAIFLEDGRCRRQGTMAALTGKNTVVRIRVSSAPDLAALERALPALALSYADSMLTVRDESGRKLEDTVALCLRELLDRGVGISELSSGDTLENAYLASRS